MRKRYYRSYLGLLLAAVIGSIVFTMIMSATSTTQKFSGAGLLAFMIGMPLTCFVLGAGPATLFVGLPIFLAVRERLRPTIAICVTFGAAIGSIPAFIWGAPPLIAGSVVSGAAGGLILWWVAHDEIERNQAQEP